MAAEKMYVLVPSYHHTSDQPTYEMVSSHPANSKKWCAQVKEVERLTGIRYNWYKGGNTSIRPITAYRFNWD